jgi:glycosyltransferase involved in cell wall biosynthesis
MKINIIVGGRFHVELLANHLIELGHDIRIYTSTPSFFFKNPKIRGLTIFIPMLFQFIRKVTKINLPSYLKLFDLAIFDYLISKIMRECDLVYGFAGNSYYCGLAAKNKGIPYLLDRACPHSDVQQKILKIEAKKNNLRHVPLNKQLRYRLIQEYELADKIVVPSDYTLKSFINKGLKREKLFLAPLEAKVYPLPPKTKNKKNNFTIGIIGGDLLRKGYIYLFEAYNDLKLKNSQLIILGNKKEILKSLKIKKIYESRDDIIFLNHVNNINNFYSKCDIFCLPSVDEGFGMVIPEAMANALPIITTTNVGSSFLVRNNINGFVIPPKNKEELKNKIEFFYKNTKAINSYGRESRNSYWEYVNSSDNYKNHIIKLLGEYN